MPAIRSAWRSSVAGTRALIPLTAAVTTHRLPRGLAYEHPGRPSMRCRQRGLIGARGA